MTAMAAAAAGPISAPIFFVSSGAVLERRIRRAAEVPHPLADALQSPLPFSGPVSRCFQRHLLGDDRTVVDSASSAPTPRSDGRILAAAAAADDVVGAVKVNGAGTDSVDSRRAFDSFSGCSGQFGFGLPFRKRRFGNSVRLFRVGEGSPAILAAPPCFGDKGPCSGDEGLCCGFAAPSSVSSLLVSRASSKTASASAKFAVVSGPPDRRRSEAEAGLESRRMVTGTFREADPGLR